MRLSDSFARLVIERATDNPPKGREDWARAMRAEFEAAEGDRLGWALGCWRAMAGWKLKADWMFLLGLLVLPALLYQVVLSRLSFELAVLVGNEAYKSFFYARGMAEFMVIAALLAAWRPDHRRKAALAAAVGPSISAYIVLMQMNEWRPFAEWVIFDGPPLVGYMAILCACWIGASMGAGIGRRFRAAAATASR